MALSKRIHAFFLTRGTNRYEAMVDQRKTTLFTTVGGTVVEIGPGAGPNLRYFGNVQRWVGLEPNTYLHKAILEEARRLGIQAEVLAGNGESIPLPDGIADAVVATLVLCSVADPVRVLREIRRVLRPGGLLYFFEHVAAPRGTVLHGMQRLVRPAWRFIADNCHPDRETEQLIRNAGFASVEAERFVLSVALVAPHISGFAVNP